MMETVRRRSTRSSAQLFSGDGLKTVVATDANSGNPVQLETPPCHEVRKRSLRNVLKSETDTKESVKKSHLKRRRVALEELQVDLKEELTEVSLNQTERSPARFDEVAEAGRDLDEKEAGNASDDGDKESDSELTYEERRQKNMEDNARFLAELNLIQLKSDVQSLSAVKKKPSMNGLAKRKSVQEPLPRRVSLRIRRKDPDGIDLPPLPVFEEPVEEHPRKPRGPMKMKKNTVDKVEEMDAERFIERLQDLASCEKDACREIKEPPVLSQFKKIDIDEASVAKVVPNRIFSVAIYPGEERLLAAAGGKWGELGLWDMDKRSGPLDGVCCFTPHSKPVSHVLFHPEVSQHLYTCSYDGTLKYADLPTGVFQEVYVSPEEEEIRLNCFSFLSPHSLVVSQSDGDVALVDTRAGTSAEETYAVHPKSIRGVEVHPTDSDYFITASVDCTVALWDTRKLSRSGNQPLQSLRHGKSVDSARFSPLTGKCILSSSTDDRLRVFDSSNLTDIKLKSTVRHNNNTGRWLSNFKPAWHPRSEELFVVGSMERPRRIELFNEDCALLHNLKSDDHLNSVCSMNAFHPTRAVVVGGNSSGRLHVFK